MIEMELIVPERGAGEGGGGAGVLFTGPCQEPFERPVISASIGNPGKPMVDSNRMTPGDFSLNVLVLNDFPESDATGRFPVPPL